jgi:hypothetical protein
MQRKYEFVLKASVAGGRLQPAGEIEVQRR